MWNQKFRIRGKTPIFNKTTETEEKARSRKVLNSKLRELPWTIMFLK